jgi:hypothetical protein
MFIVQIKKLWWTCPLSAVVRRLSKEIQVMVFDPSGSKVPQAVKQLEREATYLLPGPTVKRSGAAEFPFSGLFMIQIDWFGVVLSTTPWMTLSAITDTALVSSPSKHSCENSCTKTEPFLVKKLKAR